MSTFEFIEWVLRWAILLFGIAGTIELLREYVNKPWFIGVLLTAITLFLHAAAMLMGVV